MALEVVPELGNSVAVQLQQKQERGKSLLGEGRGVVSVPLPEQVRMLCGQGGSTWLKQGTLQAKLMSSNSRRGRGETLLVISHFGPHFGSLI